jgi:hypothetical protein
MTFNSVLSASARAAIYNAGAAPQVVSVSSYVASLTASFSVPAPSNIVSGNLLITILSSSPETYTPPTGWTLYATFPASGGSEQISVYTKTATGSEPGSYSWSASAGSADYINVGILQIVGGNTASPINGMFSKYTSTAAMQIGTSAVSIPSALGCLPIAIGAIDAVNPGSTGVPTGLTSGWTQLLSAWNSTIGYDALYIASGPLTTSTSAAVTAGWTWGGASSNFNGTSTMLFINP